MLWRRLGREAQPDVAVGLVLRAVAQALGKQLLKGTDLREDPRPAGLLEECGKRRAKHWGARHCCPWGPRGVAFCPLGPLVILLELQVGAGTAWPAAARGSSRSAELALLRACSLHARAAQCRGRGRRCWCEDSLAQVTRVS